METNPPFNIENAISEWRSQLGHSAINADNLGELEGHLRDSIVQVQQTGLSEEDAFAIASYRLGQAEPLITEFARAHPERLWFERIIWMLIGGQLVIVLMYLSHLLRGLLAVSNVVFHFAERDEFTKIMLTGAFWTAHYLIFGTLLFAAFTLLQSKRFSWEGWMDALRQRPGKWCGLLAGVSLSLVLLSLGSLLLPDILSHFMSNTLGKTDYEYFSIFYGLILSSFNVILIPVGTFWFIRRNSHAHLINRGSFC